MALSGEIAGMIFGGGGKLVSMLGKAVKAGKGSSKNTPELSGSDSGNGGCSFSGDTPVLMADGGFKTIAEIKVGEMVQTRHPVTRRIVARQVQAVWVHTDHLVDAVFIPRRIVSEQRGRTSGAYTGRAPSSPGVEARVESTRITTTVDHPYWNASTGDFESLSEFQIGDSVSTASGDAAFAGFVKSTGHVGVAYNLTVEIDHTFIVGRNGMVVHNTGGLYQCDLPGSEAGGGHAIERHVGKDDAFLVNRNKPFASTFNDLRSATAETQANLDANEVGITTWLSGNKNTKRITNPIQDSSRARVLSKASGFSEVPGRQVATELVRDPNMSDGFRVHTSYVDP